MTIRPMKNGEDEHIVFEKNREPIVDYRIFAQTQELMKKRSKSNYRGVKKFDNIYSGYLYCGDCGNPMFSMSRADLAPDYTYGTCHKRGRIVISLVNALEEIFADRDKQLSSVE